MTEQEIASAKVSMLEVNEFQDWIRDTENPDLNENPEWEDVVTAVFDYVNSHGNATRQEVEGLMREYADGIAKLRAERGDQPELPNSDAIPGSPTSRRSVYNGGIGKRIESEADGSDEDDEEDFFVTQSGTYPYGTD